MTPHVARKHAFTAIHMHAHENLQFGQRLKTLVKKLYSRLPAVVVPSIDRSRLLIETERRGEAARIDAKPGGRLRRTMRHINRGSPAMD